MSRRDIIRGAMCEPTMDMDQAWLADHAVLMRDELRALWAREKLLDAVVEAVRRHRSAILGADLDMRVAMDNLDAHDSEQGG